MTRLPIRVAAEGPANPPSAAVRWAVALRLQQSTGDQHPTQKEKRLGYAELCAVLPGWKWEHPFWSDAPAQALQQALKNLERAYRAL